MRVEITFGQTLKKEQIKNIKEYKKIKKNMCNCCEDVRVTTKCISVFSKWEVRCPECDKLLYRTYKLFWR